VAQAIDMANWDFNGFLIDLDEFGRRTRRNNNSGGAGFRIPLEYNEPLKRIGEIYKST